jgi:hypothetical protein
MYSLDLCVGRGVESKIRVFKFYSFCFASPATPPTMAPMSPYVFLRYKASAGKLLFHKEEYQLEPIYLDIHAYGSIYN